MTLLEKAQAFKPQHQGSTRHEYTDEEIDLAVAWVQDGLTLSQVSAAMKDAYAPNSDSSYGMYTFLAIALREGIRRERFELIESYL